MNKNYIFMVLAVGTVMLTSCSDELMNDDKGGFSKPGDGIVFGANAGFELDEDEANNVKTRTIYTGETYTEGGKTFEKIHWIAGDQVSIYCNEASGSLKTLDYEVTAQNTGIDGSASENYHKTGLKPVNAESGLQWGTGNHTFYSVYPATEIEYNATEKTATVTGTVLDVQTPKEITLNNKLWTVKPNMDYAYMIAKTTANPDNTSSVKLQYMPIVTAVEVTLFKSTDVKVPTINLSNIIVRSTNKTPIYGHFTVDVAEMTDSNNDGYADGIPAVTNISEANTNYMINIPMYGDYDNNGTNEALPFENGQSLTFTVFMLNNTDLNSLEISLQGIQGTKTAKFSGDGFNIQKNKKTYMRDVRLPEDLSPFDQSSWIKYLEDNAIVRTLSIPGAGGAASSALAAGGTTTIGGQTIEFDMIRQQTLSISDLWKKGVRCFEFAIDIDGTDSYNMGDNHIICAGVSTSVELQTAVNEVVDLLQNNPEEFAMVILTYETAGGFGELGNVGRNPATFMKELDGYWGTVTTACSNKGLEAALYTPSTATVGASRGKLFCIARPTSIHEDYGDDVLQSGKGTNSLNNSIPSWTDLEIANYPSNVLVIHGWGSLKDKWQQRGYSKYSLRKTASTGESYDNKPGRPFDVSHMTYNSISSGNDDPLWKGKHWNGGNLPVTSDYTITPANLNANFYYDVKPGSSDAVSNGAWVQEWARVSNFAGTSNDDILQYNYIEDSHSLFGASWVTAEADAYYWANSYDEKLTRVKETLDYSINKKIKENEVTNVTFINSLCGYFITQDYDNSLTPCRLTDRNITDNTNLTGSSAVAGMGGDIAAFAAKINQDFYEYVLTKADENGHLSGSFGIVLMDRVSNVETDPGSLIPGIIVANNFQTSQVTPAPAVALSMPRSEYDPQNDGAPAAKTRSNGGFTVTWE